MSLPTAKPMSWPFEVHHSVLGQAWHVREADEGEVQKITQRLRCPEIVARILAGRGVNDADVEAYLDTSLRRHLPDPSTLVDLDKGARRLADAVRDGETIAIFGDYDVDGGTGSAILVRYLRAIGLDALTYIPDRRAEGYGPSASAFASLAKDGARIIVTVDCGTAAMDALSWAAANAIDVIVVDHHLPGEDLPPTYAMINPKRRDDSSGLDYLSAAGVAFLLMVGLNRTLREDGFFKGGGVDEPDLLGFLDLAALGTVCDVVPLKGLNRAFVSQGLRVLEAGGNPGLAALAEVSKLSGPPSTYHLGFMFGPRINAGGRLGPAGLALKLLITESASDAKRMARELDALNAQRREVERDVLGAAILLAEKQAANGARVIVVAGETWHEGVVGIVAGRLKDRFGLPSIVLSIGEDGVAKGSGRSLIGVDLGSAVVEGVQAGVLIRGGGHGMAAGMSLSANAIDEFSAYLHGKLAQRVEKARENVARKVDGLVGLGSIDADLSDALSLGGPYGAGNPEPLVVVPRVTVAHADRVGADHVRANLVDEGGRRMKGIAFRAADNALGAALMEGDGKPLHLLGRIKDDWWNGKRQVQLQVEDAAPV